MVSSIHSHLPLSRPLNGMLFEGSIEPPKISCSGSPGHTRPQEMEDFNMVSVKWVWSLDNSTYQIELRHGRKSGIRKIYVNKVVLAQIVVTTRGCVR